MPATIFTTVHTIWTNNIHRATFKKKEPQIRVCFFFRFEILKSVFFYSLPLRKNRAQRTKSNKSYLFNKQKNKTDSK